ncbi:MAG: adenosine deaminase [Dehalococcoidales bacterium]|nr:MAG: adenosine deaminase [Dehalococcoidales bacterium]
MTNEHDKVDELRTGETWFDQVPKVELHLHLEGAIPHDALWELIQKYGGESSVPNFQSLIEKFNYRDFPHFMETWVWKNQFLREYEDFTYIAEAVARDLAGQNIPYAETFFAPSDFARHGLETQKLAEAIRTGLSRVPQTEIALVADLVRSRKLEDVSKNLAEVNEVRSLGIIGITIGGSEQDYPPEPFEEVYERARQLGFHTSAHAGEAAGPESVWGATRSLKVDRIGHGTRAIEDKRLVDYIAEHRIPIEICLISNVRTKVVDSIEKHPVRHYFDRGIPISINTDDPKMFGNSLAEEYQLLEAKLGFSRKEIRKIILQGIEVSWLSKDRKRELTKTFCENPCW